MADVKLYKTNNYQSESDSDCKEDSSGLDEDDDCMESTKLRSYKVNTQPADDTWVSVSDQVYFKKQEEIHERGDNGSISDRKITFTLRSDAKDGHERIQAFLDASMEYYNQLHSKEDPSRYLFMPTKTTSESEDGARASTMVYKRYKLSDEKTFDCFFHEQKESLLHLVDHFLNKTGKFAIQGYPHKLGLLLHGPPGTGKTSLIKALAQYTKRSIVAVPLTKVKTNQELMDIIFDQSFLVHGKAVPFRLPQSKVMFVMEDVDAAGSVVLQREDNDAVKQSDATTATKGGLRDAENLLAYHHLFSTQSAKDSSDKNKNASGKEGCGVGISGPSPAAIFRDSRDELNLAGLLNVLDGVVDCPNRIVVMTTNHPGKLDAALIRPGRINKKIYLGYMTAKQATIMARHHFKDASEDDFAAFRDAVPLDSLSPAKLEAMFAEHDELSSLVAYLNDGYEHSGLG